MAEPILVEILGVAGSGKSTLSSMLMSEDAIARAPFISARNPRHLILLASTLPRLAPLLAANFRNTPRLTWADYKLLVYTTSWRRVLRSRGTSSTAVLVLDQGPLYALVRLRAKDLGIIDRPSFQRWWSAMLSNWVRDLSLVVWLDAPDETLLRRINARPQAHSVKSYEPADAVGFLQRYRLLFMGVIDEVEHAGGAVLRFDTNRSRAEEIAGRVAEMISGMIDSA